MDLPESVSVKQLLEAGAHFGHQTSRWHPRMKKYIFTKRDGIHIIDLEQKMTQSLGTKVIIKTSGRKGQRGKIIIEYYNLDDFDRIMERLKI